MPLVDFLGSYEWFFNLIQYCQARFDQNKTEYARNNLHFSFLKWHLSNDIVAITKKNEGQVGKGNRNGVGSGGVGGGG